ncbi:hypothetical protein [Paenibacillus camelliae]|uniref:hypothetical protein n=1 Tax=Paenibacillus camelliae TaxID=512410 RepID=UPI00203E4943|nr:hypothetical protein [Paenibacillus camelliae]MCM3632936.1 hypothetical protein [Paenibacillus camelliae]
MIAAMLMLDLKSDLERILHDYAAAEAKTGEVKEPKVYEWKLPFKNPKNPQVLDQLDFPYIVLSVARGVDTADDSTVEIELAFGVHKEAELLDDGLYHPTGYYDILALMEHVRVSLQRQRVVNGKFELIKPYEWEIPDAQPMPLWVGWAKTKWQVGHVISETEGEFLHG